MGKPNDEGPSNDGPDDYASSQKPGWLKLQFTRAADFNRVIHFLRPENKETFDPNDYVVERLHSYMSYAIGKGQGVYLEDSQRNIFGLAINYNLHANALDFREIGTTCAPIQGYKTGALIVSALSLKSWWEDENLHDKKTFTIADIKKSNVGSLKLFQGLGWEIIENQFLARTINAGGEMSLPDDQKDPNIANYDYNTAPHFWLEESEESIIAYAKLLLHYMDTGVLTSKRDTDQITIDLTALDEVGLTRDVLTEIASGNLDKTALKQLSSPRPTFQKPEEPPGNHPNG
jgi:hypothetical protein